MTLPMKKLITLLTIFTAACSDGGTDVPTETNGGTDVSAGPPAALSIIAGADQADTVLATLATPITVEVKDAADVPVSGVVVNFVVTTADCGGPFAGSAATDAAGLAADLWVLGTKAGPCTMEVRAVTSAGVPQVLGSLEATILPGAAVASGPPVFDSNESAWIDDFVDIFDVIEFRDQFDNALEGPTVTLNGGVGLNRVGDSISASTEREDVVGFTVGIYTSKFDAATFAWLQDLRANSWHISFSCANNTGGGSPPDSLAVEMTTDSMVYRLFPGLGNRNANGFVYASGTVTQVRDGVESVVAITDDRTNFIHVAKSLQWGGSQGIAVSAEPIPSTYTGGSWCEFGRLGWGNWANTSPVIFSKVP